MIEEGAPQLEAYRKKRDPDRTPEPFGGRRLTPGQGFVVPKGVRHRPRAPEKTVILMVEGAGIVPTGDA